MARSLIIGGTEILPGQDVQLQLPVAKLYTDTEMSMPVHIIRAKREGPVLFVSAAVHGDELNGIEITRRLVEKKLKLLKGSLIIVPMVNVYGVLNQSRYTPDRRDLNRSFPGSAKGSLAARLAHIFLNEVVKHCDYGIDLHTGAIHRSNLPQIRANLNDPETLLLAQQFGVPVMINANLRDGSLREAAVSHGAKVLLYEAGEALRFDELSIQNGVKGIINVLSVLGMIRKRKPRKIGEPFVANRSDWMRASASGFIREFVKLGSLVEKNDVLAELNNPQGALIAKVISNRSGIVIGKQNIPLIQEGEAMYHIAYFGEAQEEVAEYIEQMQEMVKPIVPE